MNDTSGDKQAGRRGLAILLAIIGALALALAAVYFFDATALPTFLEGRSHHGHHLIRVVICLAIAIAFLIGSLVAARSRPVGPPASTATSSAGTGAGGGADPAEASAPTAGSAPEAGPWPDSGGAQWQGTSGEPWRDPGPPGSGTTGPP
jgi:hypothetical protein